MSTEPRQIGAVVHQLMSDIKEASRQPRCALHPEQNADRCPSCNEAELGREALAEAREEARRLCAAHLPRRFADAVADHPAVVEWAERATTDPYGPSLLLTGPTGTGKTYQAFGAVRHVVAATGWPWRSTTVADLLAELRPAVGAETEAVMRSYRDTQVLMLDDLGLPKDSPWTEEVLYRVVNARYASMLPTVVTTNLPPKEMAGKVGDRVASRLMEMCQVVVLPGPSMRKAPSW